MKILLIHKFHYMRGGTETFHYNLAEALAAAGHEVIFFSMADERNIPCAQDKYFVSNVDYNDNSMGAVRKVKEGFKLIYSFEAKRKIEQLIIDEKPDIAHISLINRQITYSVVDVLKKHKVPIVMHIHDLTMVCPCYTMLKPDGSICQECIERSKLCCVKNKCMKNSTLKSILGFAEAEFLAHGKYYDKIDLFIAECNFYKYLIEKSGSTKTPIIKMNNFLPVHQEYEVCKNNKGYILYFGRYAREKGIMTLLEAYKSLDTDTKLVLVGKGEELSNILSFVEKNKLEDKVEVNGAIYGSEMDRIIGDAKFIVVPSEWYENGAFVALQAMAKGKIVIASDIAGLSEIITDGETGFLAKPGNRTDLNVALSRALNLNHDEYTEMSNRVVGYIKNRCYWKTYIDTLTKKYQELIYRHEG